MPRSSTCALQPGRRETVLASRWSNVPGARPRTYNRLLAGLIGVDLSAVHTPLDDPLADDRRAQAMARKYVWWQPPERTLADRRLFLAQVMTLGSVDDVRWLLSVVPHEDLRGVLRDPPAGVFNGRSWRFWHLRLGRVPVPVLPVRPVPR